jgi:hypothetical protein
MTKIPRQTNFRTHDVLVTAFHVYDFYYSDLQQYKSNEACGNIWTGHLARTQEKRDAYKNWATVGKI